MACLRSKAGAHESAEKMYQFWDKVRLAVLSTYIVKIQLDHSKDYELNEQ